MFLLRSEKTWDKSRMRLPLLYKVLQDTKTTDELMLFIPAISSTISRASSSNALFTTEVIILQIAPRGLSERDHWKISFIPLKNKRATKVVLHIIVLSPHIVCLDRLNQSWLTSKLCIKFALGHLLVRNFVVLFSKYQASVNRYV